MTVLRKSSTTVSVATKAWTLLLGGKPGSETEAPGACGGAPAFALPTLAPAVHTLPHTFH